MMWKAKRRNFILVSSVLAAALAYSLIGYSTGTVPYPWRQPYPIKIESVCPIFNNKDKALEALRDVVPHQSNYSTFGDHDETRPTGDSTWFAYCALKGNDSTNLLSGKAEMARTETSQAWTAYQRDLMSDEGPVYRFKAGAAALVTGQTAKILTPCVPQSTFTGSAFQLQIRVHAWKQTEEPTRKKRRALAQLALGMAKYSYTHARCSVPAKLPNRVTRLKPAP